MLSKICFHLFLFLKFLEVSVILIPKNRCFSKFGEIIESITSSYSLDGYLLSYLQKLKHLLHISKWSAHSQSYTKNITWILCFILDTSEINSMWVFCPWFKSIICKLRWSFSALFYSIDRRRFTSPRFWFSIMFRDFLFFSFSYFVFAL